VKRFGLFRPWRRRLLVAATRHHMYPQAARAPYVPVISKTEGDFSFPPEPPLRDVSIAPVGPGADRSRRRSHRSRAGEWILRAGGRGSRPEFWIFNLVKFEMDRINAGLFANYKLNRAHITYFGTEGVVVVLLVMCHFSYATSGR
jgi:hypothetical protein